MRTHRVKVRISDSHELRLRLPSDFPPGMAEVIVLEQAEGDVAVPVSKHTIDELLAARLTRPTGVGPVSLSDMDRAIAEGAAGRGGT